LGSSERPPRRIALGRVGDDALGAPPARIGVPTGTSATSLLAPIIIDHRAVGFRPLSSRPRDRPAITPARRRRQTWPLHSPLRRIRRPSTTTVSSLPPPYRHRGRAARFRSSLKKNTRAIDDPTVACGLAHAWRQVNGPRPGRLIPRNLPPVGTYFWAGPRRNPADLAVWPSPF
jgi:hypothetical protein